MPINVGTFLSRFSRKTVTYILEDRFGTPIAAGGINSSYATDGKNARTVTDTESKLSIAGGELTFAGGLASPVYGDPGLWYPVMTRVAGRVLKTSIVSPSVVSQCLIAVDENQAGLPTAHCFNLTTTGLACYDNSINIVTGTWATGTNYQFAIVLRGTGAFYFIRGGAFTNWTLLWVSVANNTGTLYPTASSYNAVFTADNILVPATLWLPAPLASDSFTRANGALGSTDGLGHAEQNGGANLAWTGTTWTVSSNAAINTPTVNATLNSGNLVVGSWYKIVATQVDYFYTGCAANDVFVATATTALDANNTVKLLTLSELFATVPALSTADTLPEAATTITGNVSGGIVCNLDSAASPANFIMAYYNKQSGKCCLDEYVAGVRTSKIAATTTYAAGARLNLVRSGTEARLFYNNAAVGTVQTMTANTNKIAGMFSTDSGVSLDNYQVWARGTSSEHESLGALIT